MRVQLISDLHLEYLEEGDASINFAMLVTPSAPILLIAGDVATYDCPALPEFLNWVGSKFEFVFWVLGNHEFYNTKQVSMKDVKNKLQAMCPQNVHILDNEAVIVDDMIIIGTTLWSYVPEKYIDKVQATISDYRYMYGSDGNLITVADTNRFHAESVAFIRGEVEKNRGKHVVVLSHYSPSLVDTLHPNYYGSPLNHAFASDIEMSGVDVWCFGHTHYNVRIDKHSNGYKLVSNQFGYEGEHDGCLYKYAFVVDVGPGPHYS